MRADPVGGVVPPAHALQHSLVQAQLQAGLVKHLPLVGVPGDQPVDLDRLRLANPVAAGLGLERRGAGPTQDTSTNDHHL